MNREKDNFPAKAGEIPLPAATDSASLYSQRREQRNWRLLRAFACCVAVSTVLFTFKAFAHNVRISGRHDGPHHGPRHRMTLKEREELYLSVPSTESALAASRAYASHPHLAGSTEDFEDAKTILELFQNEFSILPPPTQPIFSAGTPESRKATLHLTSLLSSSKPSAWIDTYYPVLNTALDRSVELLGDDGEVIWSADLAEEVDPLDEDAHKYKDVVPTWHGLSRDGVAEGQLVYVNYGHKEDYDSLVAAGTNFTGKIVIARYGGNFRGLKVKGAEDVGAAAILIYSDPRDDGFVTVENGYAPYPAGPARNPSAVQRGSVQYLSMYPGDPTTPGYPSYEDAERQEGINIPGIPSLPISWHNAQRLLEEIGELYLAENSKDGKKRLSGKASKSKVKLVNHVDTKVTPIWNAMAAIPGHIRSEVVVIGGHRDAWVLGAGDPLSGTVSLHELVRGFGALLKKGWKPLRTIVIASWDAEEYGLVGSTEWGEDFSSWISDHVVAYLNVDVSVSGSRWNSGASPSLAHLIKQAALEVPHPTAEGKTLWDAREDEGPYNGPGDDVSFMTFDEEYLEAYVAEKKERQASRTGIPALGSGSDFTVFLQRLGVASSDEGFAGTPSDAVWHYHSCLDSQRWQETYADPGFYRHVAVAKHLGLLALRLTDSIIIPLNTTQYALELDEYLDKVESLVPELPATSRAPDFAALKKSIARVQSASLKLDIEKKKAEEKFQKLLSQLPIRGKCTRRSRIIKRITRWIKSIFGVSTQEPNHQHFGAWEKYLEGNAERDELLLEAHHSHHHHKFPIHKFIKAAKRVSKANKKLIAFERGFISEGGIKDREWYKHLGVAPGKWLGYGATTFPALTEALSIDHNATLAEYEAGRLTSLLEKLADQIHP